MSDKMKTLGDQLRNAIVGKPGIINGNGNLPIAEEIQIPELPKEKKASGGKAKDKSTIDQQKPSKDILTSIREFSYSTSTHNDQLRVRLDENTVRMLNQFKFATGIDMNKVIAFSLDKLFAECPELKTIIKQSLENFKL